MLVKCMSGKFVFLVVIVWFVVYLFINYVLQYFKVFFCLFFFCFVEMVVYQFMEDVYGWVVFQLLGDVVLCCFDVFLLFEDLCQYQFGGCFGVFFYVVVQKNFLFIGFVELLVVGLQYFQCFIYQFFILIDNLFEVFYCFGVVVFFYLYLVYYD